VHVSAEQNGEAVLQGREWIVTTRITVRMTSKEYQEMDGLRYEAFPWTRFRLKLSRQPPGAEPGGWRYEVRDNLYRDDDTAEPAVVRSGARPTWDTARQDGQAALLDARRAATDEDNSGTLTLPITGASLSEPGSQPGR
jgi:hypothetical protein